MSEAVLIAAPTSAIMGAVVLLAMILVVSCAALSPRPGVHAFQQRLPRHSILRGSASPTPEEHLLAAVGFMRDNDFEKARSSVAKARQLCDGNGGPSAEQAALLELLDSRLPTIIQEDEEPSLAEMFPGTTAAPTGESLVLPGTPSMADLAAKAKEKREAAADAARRTGESGPSMCAQASVHAKRRTTIATLCTLPLAGALSSASAKTELEFFDYLSPARLAVKKQRQKQEECFDAGFCADEKPYYAIECERGDTDCLQRKRRLASQEIKNFSVDPFSSPILLLAASAFVFQWGSAAVRISASLIRRARDEPGGDA